MFGRNLKRPASPAATTDEATSTFTQRLDRGFDDFARQFGGRSTNTTQHRRISTFGHLDFSGSEEGDDDHSLRHSPPNKVQRFNDEADANRFALIQAKSSSALQQTTVNRLRRELVEEKTEHRRVQRRLKELEEKVMQTTLNGERLRTNELNRSIEALDSAQSGRDSLNQKNAQLQTELTDLHAQLATVQETAIQNESEMQRQLSALRAELSTERSQRIRFETDAERLGQDIDTFRNRNTVLMEELTRSIERVHQAEKLQREAAEQLRKFEDECQLAMSMRYDMLELNRLRTEYDALRQKTQLYKSNCDNTALLKEKVIGLECRVVRLEAENASLIRENNELKSAISQSSRRDGQESRMATIDSLTQRLVALNQRSNEQDEQLRSARKQIRDLETNAAQRTSSHESIVLDLNQRLMSALEQVTQLRESVDRLETLERDANEMRVQCESWRTQVAEKDAQIVRLSDQLSHKADNTQSTTSISSSPVSSESDAFVKQLQAKVAEQQEMIDGLKERLHMKGDFNPDTTKVLHMDFNPIDMAHDQYKREMETMKKENETMRLRLDEFEKQRAAAAASRGDEDDVTGRVQLRQSEIEHQRQLNELKEKIAKVEKEKQRSREIQTQVSTKYREMCTQLTGFQCKMKDEHVYQVQSVYDQDNFFLFKKGEQGELQLLESEYTPHWTDFIETYLQTDHCIPAFLAAVTMHLYARDGRSDMHNDDTAASSQPVSFIH